MAPRILERVHSPDWLLLPGYSLGAGSSEIFPDWIGRQILALQGLKMESTLCRDVVPWSTVYADDLLRVET